MKTTGWSKTIFSEPTYYPHALLQKKINILFISFQEPINNILIPGPHIDLSIDENLTTLNRSNDFSPISISVEYLNRLMNGMKYDPPSAPPRV